LLGIRGPAVTTSPQLLEQLSRIAGILTDHAAVASGSLGDFWAAFDDTDVTVAGGDI